MARAPAAADADAPPEADRLDDFPHPRETQSLVGQDTAQAVLAEGLASGRMHHAWLLAGPRGVGKATLAYQFARMALARPEERDLFGQGLSIEPELPDRPANSGVVASGAAHHPPHLRPKDETLFAKHSYR